jgi:hypothetical protein
LLLGNFKNVQAHPAPWCSLTQEKHFTGYYTIIAEIAGMEKDTGLAPAFIKQGGKIPRNYNEAE